MLIKDDLTGQRFGKLTVVGWTMLNSRGHKMYLCDCDCGGSKTVSRNQLKSGKTRSCGCLRAEGNPGKREYTTQNKSQTLCDTCIRSAAPPSLQCIWDSSRAKILPEGAKITDVYDSSETNRGKRLTLFKIVECPEYLDMRIPENKELLLEERRKNLLAFKH